MRRRDIGRRRCRDARWCVSPARVGLMLALALAAPAWLPSIAHAQGVPGDVNCNGVADDADRTALDAALFAAESTCPTADVNGDGDVTAADLVALILILAEQATPTVTQ